MSVLTKYVCPHQLCLSQPIMSVPIYYAYMSVPTYHVCFHLFSPIATVGLHLGFSARMKIWQVPGCKMEPRSGMIMQVMTTHPATPVLAYLSTEWLLDRVSELSEGCLPAV